MYPRPELRSGGDIDIWVRRNSDESKNEVDIYAIFKRLKDGTWVLGIGRTWREYGEIDEFVLNIGMAEKMFIDCLPGEPLTEVKADEQQKGLRGSASSAVNEKPSDDSESDPDNSEDEDKEKTNAEEDSADEPAEDKDEQQEGTEEESEDGTVDFDPEEDHVERFDDYSE